MNDKIFEAQKVRPVDETEQPGMTISETETVPGGRSFMNSRKLPHIIYFLLAVDEKLTDPATSTRIFVTIIHAHPASFKLNP